MRLKLFIFLERKVNMSSSLNIQTRTYSGNASYKDHCVTTLAEMFTKAMDHNFKLVISNQTFDQLLGTEVHVRMCN